MPEVVVASYNVHGGVDGWGRPFDVVGACRQVDADVLVLQESWTPDGGQSVGRRVADALGATVVELALARGKLFEPPPGAGRRWGPRLWERRANGLRLDARAARRRAPPLSRAPAGPRSPVRGTWGIAVLSRARVMRSQTIDLGQLRSDPAHRGAIVLDVEVEGSGLRVVGTHLSHLSQGSPLHIQRLRRALRAMGSADAIVDPSAVGPAVTGAVLAGDMNLWGPPLSAMFPGWARAVRGRTWPTWFLRPLAQSDHILVSRSVGVRDAAVVPVGGSDHFPVRARLVLP